MYWKASAGHPGQRLFGLRSRPSQQQATASMSGHCGVAYQQASQEGARPGGSQSEVVCECVRHGLGCAHGWVQFRMDRNGWVHSYPLSCVKDVLHSLRI